MSSPAPQDSKDTFAYLLKMLRQNQPLCQKEINNRKIESTIPIQSDCWGQ